jgi:hypothetical protein
VDIAAAIGTSVRSVAKGRVDFASDDFEGAGGTIVLNHGDGWYTLYEHLSDVLVQSGQEVAARGGHRPRRRRGLAQGADPALRGAQGHGGREPGELAALKRSAGPRVW